MLIHSCGPPSPKWTKGHHQISNFSLCLVQFLILTIRNYMHLLQEFVVVGSNDFEFAFKVNLLAYDWRRLILIQQFQTYDCVNAWNLLRHNIRIAEHFMPRRIIQVIQIEWRKIEVNRQVKYKPEMHRSISTKENLSLARVYCILYPIQCCVNRFLICIFYLHFHLNFLTFLEITTPGQSWKKFQSFLHTKNG